MASSDPSRPAGPRLRPARPARLRGASRVRGLAWLLGAIALAFAAASALPGAARLVPWRVERWLGSVAGAAPPVAPCAGTARSREILARLVGRIDPVFPGDRELPITVEIVPGETVNAYATLGGHIYVFDGLLRQARSAEELAGVLAHEIEHVRNRHIIQAVALNLLVADALRIVLPGDGAAGAQLAGLLLNLQFGRAQEAEADAQGLRRLEAAQVDAAGFEAFFARAQNMPEPPQFLSSHPASESRRLLAAQRRGYPVRPVLAPGEWEVLAAMCR